MIKVKNVFVTLLCVFLLLNVSCTLSSNKPDKTVNEKIPFDFPDFREPVFKDQTFNILNYGAKQGDSLFLNTEAIRSAIKACHESGGGKVLIPEGKWMTGPVHLLSNVNLHLEEGAELIFSQNFDDYLPVILIQRGGFFCYNYSPPVYARNCENIAVTGAGVLNGKGQIWWPWKKRQPGMVRLFQMGKNGVPVEDRVFGTEEAGVRPPFIQFLECKNILLEDITVKDGPSWNVHPVFCENMIIRGIKVIAHGPNNDGIDPDGCKNVLIEDCYVDTGDDCICLKSGRDEEAWKIGRPCENIIVRRCTTKAGNGGVVIGSEMSADVRNVLVEDCSFDGTSIGLRFKTRIGRKGVVENIFVRNINMNKIKGEAISLDLNYDGEPIERDMKYREGHIDLVNAPLLRNFYFEDISCNGAGLAIKLEGLPGSYLREIFFKNISIRAKKGLKFNDVHDVVFNNVLIESSTD